MSSVHFGDARSLKTTMDTYARSLPRAGSSPAIGTPAASVPPSCDSLAPFFAFVFWEEPQAAIARTAPSMAMKRNFLIFSLRTPSPPDQ